MPNAHAITALKKCYQHILDSYGMVDAVTGQPVQALRPYLRLGVYQCGFTEQRRHTCQIIAPVFIAHLLTLRQTQQSDNLVSHDAAARHLRPEHFIQSPQFYFSLLRAECQRLGWSELTDDLLALSSHFYDEPWHLERFALAYFYGLLANDTEYLALLAPPQHEASLHTVEQVNHRRLLLNAHLAKTPNLHNLIEEYVFFAFYNLWGQTPP
jgi:hypothetical protein